MVEALILAYLVGSRFCVTTSKAIRLFFSEIMDTDFEGQIGTFVKIRAGRLEQSGLRTRFVLSLPNI